MMGFDTSGVQPSGSTTKEKVRVLVICKGIKTFYSDINLHMFE
jgi:hypothetical protein